MTDKELEELKHLFKAAEEKRRPHECEIEEAFELTKSTREWRAYNSNYTTPDRNAVFDATLSNMARNLVTNTINLLIPPQGQWAKIAFRSDELERRLQVQFADRVAQANDLFFRHLADSNFYVATTEALYDEVIAGTMCVMFVDEEDAQLTYRAVPSDELFFLDNHNEKVDVVFRKHDMTARQLVQRFGNNVNERVKDAIAENQPTKKFTILESVIPDGSSFAYSIVFHQDWEPLTDRQEMPLNPFVVARWEKMLRSVWGNSPVRDAMNHQRVANQIKSDMLRHGAYAANGLWQVEDETVNTANLRNNMPPGSVIAVDEPLRPVPFPGQFSLNENMIEQEREQMKRIMFDSTPPSEDALKYMNDVAVQFLRNEFFSQVGEPAQRLQREYLQPIAEQAVLRLQRRGEIAVISPDEVRALGIPGATRQSDLFRVDVNAAIQRAQGAQEASEIMNAVANAGAVYGPQQVALHVDLDEATRKSLLGMGVPENMLRKNSEVQRAKKELEQMALQLSFNSLLTQQGRDPLTPPEQPPQT